LRAGDAAGAALAIVLLLGASSDVAAHRLDECLQAATIAVEPDHVALDLSLTPGVDVVGRIIQEIDRNGDGAVTVDEQRAFAATLVASIALSNDGHALELRPADITFPELVTLRRGEGTIRLQSTAPLSPQAPGGHQLSFQNRYRPEVSVYLANALVPESRRIAVTSQHRAHDQHELTLSYSVSESRATSLWVLTGVAIALAAVLLRPDPRPHS
jgi:hypothetical protein